MTVLVERPGQPGQPETAAPESLAVARDPRDPFTRFAAILDPGSLAPLSYRPDGHPDDSGVVAVTGTIDGSKVVVYATDPRKQGGAMGREGCAHIVAAIETAVAEAAPVIGIWHSGGARLREGVDALDGVGRVFAAMVQASGKVPQISVVVGPAAGGAAYGPALTDVVILAPEGRIFVTGPDVVRAVTGEAVDMPRLGGPDPHARRSGVAHIVTDSEAEAYNTARKLAALLADQGELADPEALGADPGLPALFPADRRRAYDVRPVVERLLDAPGIELLPKWAPNIVTTLGRLGGRTVGVLANNPLRLGGCLDAASAEKAARFVRTCDAFGIPIVVVVDVPGYLPGLAQEWGGVVRRGAKLLHAFAEAVVPRVTIVTRKAFGGAYIAMNASALGANTVLAWPDAEVAVMGAKAAVEVLHRKQLAQVPAGPARDALLEELAAEHERLAGGLDRAVKSGHIDHVIDPAHTRGEIVKALAAAPRDLRGQHGNIPL